MTDTRKLARENIRLLEEGIAVLSAISDTDYILPSQGASPVGEHFRHIVNHYDALLAGGTRIDYDTRERLHPVASNRLAALAKLRELIDALGECNLPADPVVERMITGPRGRLETVSMQTTAARELDFLVSHTTHHYAVIAMLLHSRQISIPPEFGMSRSTLAHLAGESIPG